MALKIFITLITTMSDAISNSQYLVFLGGVITGVIGPGIITLINKHYDEKKHLRETVTKNAIENWKGGFEALKTLPKGKKMTIYPLDTFLIHHAKLSEIMSKKKFDIEELKKILEENKGLMKIYDQHNPAKKN